LLALRLLTFRFAALGRFAVNAPQAGPLNKSDG